MGRVEVGSETQEKLTKNQFPGSRNWAVPPTHPDSPLSIYVVGEAPAPLVDQVTDIPPTGCWENRMYLSFSFFVWPRLETNFSKLNPILILRCKNKIAALYKSLQFPHIKWQWVDLVCRGVPEIKATNGGYSLPAVSVLIINFLPDTSKYKWKFPVVIDHGMGRMRAAGNMSIGQLSPFTLENSQVPKARSFIVVVVSWVFLVPTILVFLCFLAHTSLYGQVLGWPKSSFGYVCPNPTEFFGQLNTSAL